MIPFADALAACVAAWGDPSDIDPGYRAEWEVSPWSHILLIPGRLALWDAGMSWERDETEPHDFADAATLAVAIDELSGCFRKVPRAGAATS